MPQGGGTTDRLRVITPDAKSLDLPEPTYMFHVKLLTKP